MSGQTLLGNRLWSANPSWAAAQDSSFFCGVDGPWWVHERGLSIQSCL